MDKVTVLLGLVLAIVLVAIFAVYQTTNGRDKIEGHLCAEEYAAAHSVSDSARIDARPPIKNRGRGELARPIPTCGELRRAGRVR